MSVCGIIGLVSSPAAIPNVVPELVKGLKKLEYRGYDSAGFAFIVVRNGIRDLVVLKDRGRIDDVVEKYGVLKYKSLVGIAHTRWATHGKPSKVNAHPHVDCTNTIAVVHNGIIKNYAELRRRLEALGHEFKSETDTEVIPHLLEELLGSGLSLLDAMKRLTKVLEGSYAIAVITTRDPRRIYFAKRLSPLVLGLGRGFNVVSSDIPSFLHLTRRVVVLRDLEYGFLSANEILVKYGEDVVDHSTRIRMISWSAEEAEKGGYPHFMLKEIMEQPRALHETYYGLLSSDELFRAAEALASADVIYITGAGTSYHAALFFSLYLSLVAKRQAIPFIASEAQIYSATAQPNSVLVAVSQSGETIDTLMAVREFKQAGAKVIAVSNVIDSAIPRESDHAVYTRAGPEIGVAATKTFLTQVLCLQMLATYAARYAGTLSERECREIVSHLSKAPHTTSRALARTMHLINSLALKLMKAHNMYILSRHLGVPLAYEAALKIKEVSYIHAESYPAGESKHGPIALVEKDFPVIFINVPIPEIEEKLSSNVMEMAARGAFTVVVGPRPRTHMNANVLIDAGDADVHLLPYAVMPPMQLLAYRLAVLLGRDPDKPRNLAKTVTVE